MLSLKQRALQNHLTVSLVLLSLSVCLSPHLVNIPFNVCPCELL